MHAVITVIMLGITPVQMRLVRTEVAQQKCDMLDAPRSNASQRTVQLASFVPSNLVRKIKTRHGW